VRLNDVDIDLYQEQVLMLRNLDEG
jgi:hypothetical protein